MNSKKPKTYEEKLRDPRWQRLRLIVMNEAGWACEECGDGMEELHAHHRNYRPDAEPWQYGAEELRCLCTTCHTLTHLDQKKVVGFVEKIMVGRGAAQMWVTDYNARVKAEVDAKVSRREATQADFAAWELKQAAKANPKPTPNVLE